MNRLKLLSLTLVLGAACGGSTSGTGIDSGGGNGDSGGNADTGGGGTDTGGGGVDAGSGGGNTITIKGTTAAAGFSGETPEGGVTVAAFKASDDTKVTSGTSDGSGNFTLTLTLTGGSLDGYIKASMGNTYLPTYLYPPKPLTANFTGAQVELLTSQLYTLSGSTAGVSQSASKGFIGIEVRDGAGGPVAGAVVTATSGGAATGTVKYNNASGGTTPDKNATATGSDGIAYVFNVPAGTIAVSATKAGTTFATHDVKTIVDTVTETIIEP